MAIPVETVKMVTVDEDSFVAFGYASSKRQLHVTLRNNTTLVFQNVPGFRYEGLLAAPRKEAYYKTFIQNAFLAKPAPPPAQT
jgi:hypothetical protein